MSKGQKQVTVVAMAPEKSKSQLCAGARLIQTCVASRLAEARNGPFLVAQNCSQRAHLTPI